MIFYQAIVLYQKQKLKRRAALATNDMLDEGDDDVGCWLVMGLMALNLVMLIREKKYKEEKRNLKV